MGIVRLGLRGRPHVWAAAPRRPFSIYSRLRNVGTALQNPADEDLSRTRNIGIIAHIDAGKTTTTERMLYYSGYTRRIGDVDEGSTVTDFLAAERARGITIQSAAITFNWPPIPGSGQGTLAASKPTPRSFTAHNINLIDTPGHADFTFEVLRSLRILDGAVCILDGVAGVEAQTEKVWAQADAYRIPRLVYVNKLDRDGAAFGRTVKEVGVRLRTWPAVCQIPWYNASHEKLLGVVDIVSLRGLRWEEGSDGRQVTPVSSEKIKEIAPKLYEEMRNARVALIELLSEHDDAIVEEFFERNEDHLAIPSELVTGALRRCVMQFPQRIVPVFAGASFKNIGVQPVLDAVVDLLPSPNERPPSDISIGGVNGRLDDLVNGKLELSPVIPDGSKKKGALSPQKSKAAFMVQNIQGCALAFKVVNDAKRGVLVYVRVYSGSISRMAPLFNTNLQLLEKAPRLLKMYANDAIDVPSIPAGQIGVIAGLKFARTGDTLLSYTGVNPKVGPPSPINTLQLRPIVVPPPVFFTSIEPNTLSEEKPVLEALGLLLREDPSLQVTVDSESGQTHLAGMGELHLEIATDRLIDDMKAKARIGKIEIGYREAINTASAPCTETLNREVAGKLSQAACTASVANIDNSTITVNPESYTQTVVDIDSNQLIINHPTLTRMGEPSIEEYPALPPTMPFTTILTALQTGVAAALARGPQLHFPIHSAQITIDFDHTTQLFPETTSAAISLVARQSVQAALRLCSQEGGSVLMEPVMLATLSVPESDLGNVVHDLSSARGGQVVSLDGDDADPAAGSRDANSADDEPIYIDAHRIYAPPDPFGGGSTGSVGVSTTKQRQITARVPLKEMVGYLKHLRSLTGGRGTFVMAVDRFERMSAQRQKVALNELRGGF